MILVDERQLFSNMIILENMSVSDQESFNIQLWRSLPVEVQLSILLVESKIDTFKTGECFSKPLDYIFLNSFAYPRQFATYVDAAIVSDVNRRLFRDKGRSRRVLAGFQRTL
jgi:hypothetical protein